MTSARPFPRLHATSGSKSPATPIVGDKNSFFERSSVGEKGLGVNRNLTAGYCETIGVRPTRFTHPNIHANFVNFETDHNQAQASEMQDPFLSTV